MSQFHEQLRDHIQNEFTRRRRTNPHYSLRTFAKFLEVDSSTLSQIFNGKRGVTMKLWERIKDKIPETRPLHKSPNDTVPVYQLLSQDVFSLIADWYHFAILDLTLLPDFKLNSKWVAKRLGIAPVDAKMALERLIRLGLLRKTNGTYRKAESHYVNYQEGQTSEAHKEYQRQILRLGLRAIDHTPPHLKDITAITIAGNTKKINKAKELIKKFRRELCQLMEDGEGDEVFHFALQLYPVTNHSSNPRKD